MDPGKQDQIYFDFGNKMGANPKVFMYSAKIERKTIHVLVLLLLIQTVPQDCRLVSKSGIMSICLTNYAAFWAETAQDTQSDQRIWNYFAKWPL